MKDKLIVFFKIVVVLLILCVPVLNIWFVYKTNIPTLYKWTSYKDLLWCTYIKNIKITYNYNGEKLILYKGKFGLLYDPKELQKLLRYEIKYICGYEDDHLVVQLWNTKKLNKLIEKGKIYFETLKECEEE